MSVQSWSVGLDGRTGAGAAAAAPHGCSVQGLVPGVYEECLD